MKPIQKKAVLIVVSAGIILYGGFIGYKSWQRQDQQQIGEQKEAMTVITSFYPMTLHTQELLKNTPHTLETMASQLVGCLHDYQLTVEDTKCLHEGDVLIINGQGAEGFMDKLYTQNPDLQLIDASKDYTELLMSEHHHDHEHEEGEEAHDHEYEEEAEEAHDHEHEEEGEEAHDHEHEEEGEEAHDHEHEEEAEEAHDHEHEEEGEETHDHEHEEGEEAHDHEHEHEEVNTHIWMSIEGSIYQVQQISKALQEVDPQYKATYQENEEAYVEALRQLQEEAKASLAPQKGQPVASVHDTFDYFIKDMGLNLVATIPEGTHESASPQEIEAIIEEMIHHKVSVILTSQEYAELGIVEMIAEATGAKVVVLDALLAEDDKTHASDGYAYVARMRKNIQKLGEVGGDE